MKLKIKETGEILEDVKFIDTTLHKITIQYLDNGVLRECSIENLSDIEEVKDYKEPEKYFWIDTDGFIVSNDMSTKDVAFEIFKENLKSIGNYFETKEEAERAREKLKAWKRLKDKGFKVDLWDYDGSDGQGRIRTGRILFRVKDYEENDKDLDLLFGGEE